MIDPASLAARDQNLAAGRSAADRVVGFYTRLTEADVNPGLVDDLTRLWMESWVSHVAESIFEEMLEDDDE